MCARLLRELQLQVSDCEWCSHPRQLHPTVCSQPTPVWPSQAFRWEAAPGLLCIILHGPCDHACYSWNVSLYRDLHPVNPLCHPGALQTKYSSLFLSVFFSVSVVLCLPDYQTSSEIHLTLSLQLKLYLIPFQMVPAMHTSTFWKLPLPWPAFGFTNPFFPTSFFHRQCGYSLSVVVVAFILYLKCTLFS